MSLEKVISLENILIILGTNSCRKYYDNIKFININKTQIKQYHNYCLCYAPYKYIIYLFLTCFFSFFLFFAFSFSCFIYFFVLFLFLFFHFFVFCFLVFLFLLAFCFLVFLFFTLSSASSNESSLL